VIEYATLASSSFCAHFGGKRTWGGSRSLVVTLMRAVHNARAWAREIDATGYLPKPFDYLDLITAVEVHQEHNGHGSGNGGGNDDGDGGGGGGDAQHKTIH
jgi:hypothetical protein